MSSDGFEQESLSAFELYSFRSRQEIFEDLLWRRRLALARCILSSGLLNLLGKLVSAALDQPTVQNVDKGHLLVQRKLIGSI